jgi:hypothetical protein
MNQHVENGRTITICPHCHSDVSGCMLIIYYVVADGGEPSVWRCPRCEGEWPCQSPLPPQRREHQTPQEQHYRSPTGGVRRLRGHPLTHNLLSPQSDTARPAFARPRAS